MKLNISKYQYIDKHNNKKGQDLDQYEQKSDEYIFLSFSPPKKLNRQKDLIKKKKSLNHFVYILKFY